MAEAHVRNHASGPLENVRRTGEFWARATAIYMSFKVSPPSCVGVHRPVSAAPVPVLQCKPEVEQPGSVCLQLTAALHHGPAAELLTEQGWRHR